MSKKFIEKDFSTKPTVFLPFADGLNLVVAGRISVKKREKGSKVFLMVNIKDSNGQNYSQCVFKGVDIYDFFDPFVGHQPYGCIAEGTYKENNGFHNFDISNIEINADDDCTAETPVDYGPQLRNAIHSIKDPILNAIAMEIYRSKEFSAKMLVAPATEYSAYNVKGGLLHLIVDTANMANTVAMALNSDFGKDNCSVNRDLLMAGAVLCNIGRVYTIKMDEYGNILKTEQGILDTDSAVSRDMVRDAIKSVLNSNSTAETPLEVNDDVLTDLIHMVSSCRERPEFGAVCVPRTKHAMILANVCSLIFSKAMFETLAVNNFGERTAKSYDNGRNYVQMN